MTPPIRAVSVGPLSPCLWQNDLTGAGLFLRQAVPACAKAGSPHALAEAGMLYRRSSWRSYAAALGTVLLILTADTRAQTPPATLTTIATVPLAALPTGDGVDPLGLVVGNGGVLYGVTQSGGSTNSGTVFSLTPPKSAGGSWTEASLYSFTGGSDGAGPTSLVIGPGGVLYGTTGSGGTGKGGTMFSLIPPAPGLFGGTGGPWTEKVLYSFNASGGPENLAIGPGGVLYGTGPGGTANAGAVYSLTPPTSPSGVWTEAVIYSFPALSYNGSVGPSSLAIGPGGVLYGATLYGGTGTAPLCQFPPGGCGTVFSLTPPTSASSAWTAATIYNFTGSGDGGYPAGVVVGAGGVLYGAASNGGPSSTGVVFALTPPAGAQSAAGGAWTESVLYNGGSEANVVIGAGGVLYAVIRSSPVSSSFAVVSLTPPGAAGAWTPSMLYSFTTGGSVSSLVVGTDGALFGATGSGGAANAGLVYSVTPPAGSGGQWIGTTIYAFTGGNPPGTNNIGALAISASGVLYGFTTGGGGGSCPGGCGIIFSLTPPASAGGNWTESVLHTFEGGSDGAFPAGLTVGPGGVLYGTTTYGGAGICYDSGPIPGCGTVFSLTPSASSGGTWTESVLHSFALPNPCSATPCAGGSDGAFPGAGVAIGSGGVLYGTTAAGGTGGCNFGCGTAFQLTPPASTGGAWTEIVIYNFITPSGISPMPPGPDPSGLAISIGGVLYGTTVNGGNLYEEYFPACGSVFSLTPPANPGSVWTETDLYLFSGSAGCYVHPGVAIGNDGVLYGSVGAGELGHGFEVANPAIFSLTPPESPGGAWTEAVLYTFEGPVGVAANGVTIGSGPGGQPVLYGTYPAGGSGQCTGPYAGCGVVFELVPPPSSGGGWLEATLHDFTGGSDGAFPNTGVVIGNGPSGQPVLYGTTQPNANTATIFSLQPLSALSPSINAGGVVNAASYTAPVAPGSIASAFGDFFLALPLSATQSPLPTNISGVSLQFGDSAEAPLFFASGGQVNFQVPWELSGQSVTLTATVNGQTSGAQTMPLAPFAPAIFTTDSSGSGQGAILDTSYRLVDASNPASAGSTISIYCTGLGPVTNQPPTGSPAPSSPLSWSGTPTVTIGGVPANVSFSGLAPGYVGLYQVNAQVPAGLAASGAVPVVLQMGGITSNTATIAVQ